MKECLVIVDMQNGFVNHNTEHLPVKISEFIEKNHFDSIVATRYCNSPETACWKLGNWRKCMSGTLESEIVPFIQPYIERTFNKTTYSGFTSEFREFMKSENFDKLYFCGVNTDCCVLATVFDCYDAIQEFSVVADLCASTLGKTQHNHALALMRDNITANRIINSYDINI